jgi:hypothetical protein
MKRSAIFGLASVGMTAFALQRAYAGSALAMEIHHGNLATA